MPLAMTIRELLRKIEQLQEEIYSWVSETKSIWQTGDPLDLTVEQFMAVIVFSIVSLIASLASLVILGVVIEFAWGYLKKLDGLKRVHQSILRISPEGFKIIFWMLMAVLVLLVIISGKQ